MTDLLQRVSVFFHGDRVTRDIDADSSGGAHPVPLHIAVFAFVLDETMGVVLMAGGATSAITGHMGQKIRMCVGEHVGFPGPGRGLPDKLRQLHRSGSGLL